MVSNRLRYDDVVKAQNVHGRVYVHREQIPLKTLSEGLEKLKYDEVVKVLRA
jgi:hypothetical protein